MKTNYSIIILLLSIFISCKKDVDGLNLDHKYLKKYLGKFQFTESPYIVSYINSTLPELNSITFNEVIKISSQKYSSDSLPCLSIKHYLYGHLILFVNQNGVIKIDRWPYFCNGKFINENELELDYYYIAGHSGGRGGKLKGKRIK
jgi:hypothetical protein